MPQGDRTDLTLQAGLRLSRGEQLVAQAMRHYVFKDKGATRRDFVAFDVLYRRYQFGFNHEPWPPYNDRWDESADMTLMSKAKFGYALRRVVPDIESLASRPYVNGKYVRGFRYVTGPDSIKVRINSGRPKVIHAKK